MVINGATASEGLAQDPYIYKHLGKGGGGLTQALRVTRQSL